MEAFIYILIGFIFLYIRIAVASFIADLASKEGHTCWKWFVLPFVIGGVLTCLILITEKIIKGA